MDYLRGLLPENVACAVLGNSTWTSFMAVFASGCRQIEAETR